MKQVLFLAPGYRYAETVIKNLSNDLRREHVQFENINCNTMCLCTDKVRVTVAYMDPIKWTPDLFRGRDAIFGKKELVAKAREQFFSFIVTPDMSMTRYIKDIHNELIEAHKPRTTYLPEITKVHFNPPMTIVLWDDGTKTTVKCQEGDIYSEEVGLSLCITKKALGNMSNFNNVFRKWIPEEEVAKTVGETLGLAYEYVSSTAVVAETFGEKLRKIGKILLGEE